MTPTPPLQKTWSFSVSHRSKRVIIAAISLAFVAVGYLAARFSSERPFQNAAGVTASDNDARGVDEACRYSLGTCERELEAVRKTWPAFDAEWDRPVSVLREGQPFIYTQGDDIWLTTYRAGTLEKRKVISRDLLRGAKEPLVAVSSDGRWFAYASFRFLVPEGEYQASDPESGLMLHSEWPLGGDAITVIDLRSGASWDAFVSGPDRAELFTGLRFEGNRFYAEGSGLLAADPAARVGFVLDGTGGSLDGLDEEQDRGLDCRWSIGEASPNGRYALSWLSCIEGGSLHLADLAVRKLIRDYGFWYVCDEGRLPLGFTSDNKLYGYEVYRNDDQACTEGYRVETYEPATGSVLKLYKDIPPSETGHQEASDLLESLFGYDGHLSRETVASASGSVSFYWQNKALYVLPAGEEAWTLVDLDVTPVR